MQNASHDVHFTQRKKESYEVFALQKNFRGQLLRNQIMAISLSTIIIISASDPFLFRFFPGLFFCGPFFIDFCQTWRLRNCRRRVCLLPCRPLGLFFLKEVCTPWGRWVQWAGGLGPLDPPGAVSFLDGQCYSTPGPKMAIFKGNWLGRQAPLGPWADNLWHKTPPPPKGLKQPGSPGHRQPRC